MVLRRGQTLKLLQGGAGTSRGLSELAKEIVSLRNDDCSHELAAGVSGYEHLGYRLALAEDVLQILRGHVETVLELANAAHSVDKLQASSRK